MPDSLNFGSAITAFRSRAPLARAATVIALEADQAGSVGYEGSFNCSCMGLVQALHYHLTNNNLFLPPAKLVKRNVFI